MKILELEYYPKLTDKIISASIERIQENQDKWEKPFFTDTSSYLDFEKIDNITSQFPKDEIENVIILGTGGSIQTVLALSHLVKKRLFSITSSRAVELKRCLSQTEPSNSIVIPISRGGETLDVNSTIGIFLKNGYKILGLSSKGTMHDILYRSGVPILDVPDLSGRFAGSITNVGIVPAYFLGIDIESFLKGLKNGYEDYMVPEKNDSLNFACFLYEMFKKGYRVVFSMPYSYNLEGSVGLFVQEISESSGKEDKGLMGTFQEAPLCQHSVLEFLLGGSKGNVIPVLWTIANEFPEVFLESSIDFVDGKSAQTIVNYQANATFQALLEQKIPSGKVEINNPNEYNIGKLIAFIQSSVYYLCVLLDVNWSDNPKVNVGKKICNEALKSRISAEEFKTIRENLSKEKFSDFY